MKIVTLDAGTLPVNLIKPAYCNNWVYRSSTQECELLAVLDNAEVVITNKVPLRRAVLEKLPSLRFICVAATGYDCVDVDYCREKGISVSNIPGYSTRSVSEGVIASLFALRRSLPEYSRAARNEWHDSAHFCLHKTPVNDIESTTLGIVGRGDIGSAVARMAKGLGMTVRFAERPGQRVIREGYSSFEEVICTSDVLTLHCPLTPKTYQLINRQRLSEMKPGSVIINTARGQLINEDDLADALNSGHIGGAALDVLSQEPPPENSRLVKLEHPNLIITPHIAWASNSGVSNLVKGINYNLAGYFAGTLKNSVI